MEFIKDFLDMIPFGFLIVDTNNKVYFANKKALEFLDSARINYYVKKINKCKSNEISKIKVNDNSIIIERHKINRIDENTVVYGIIIYNDEYINGLFLNTETSDEYKAILDSIQDAVFIDDKQGKTLWINKACEMLYKIKREDIIGKSSDELEKMGVLSPSVAKLVMKKNEQVSILQNTKYGKKVLITGTPIRDDKGTLRKIISTSRDITELIQLKNEMENVYKELEELRCRHMNFEGFVVESKEMRNLMQLISKLALLDTTVLITGESGVGKGEIAKYIHKTGKRKDEPFITINCGAIPESLLESELFGYEPGAFTGSSREGKKGLFELAHKGTIFLDEIAELPLNLQVKILQVIQDKEFKRVGGLKSIKTDVRIIVATNRDLRKMVEENKFREDLYYRLNVIPIHIPPLRERNEDIIPLVNHFIKEYNKKYGVSKKIGSSAMNCMVKYPWPGNVRELKNIIERLVITTSEELITIDHLPRFIVEHTKTNNDININGIIKLKDAVREVEKKIIKNAFKKYKTTRKMARVLGVSQPTVVRKLKKYRICDTQMNTSDTK